MYPYVLLLLSSLASVSATTCRGSSNDETRIVGGDTAEEDRYSFAAYLVDEDGDQFCGGTVITDDVVVSAAHCGGGRYDVVVGRHNRNHNDGEVIGVAKELIHPSWDEDTDDNDIMLLFLDRPINLDYVKFASVTDEYVGVAVPVTVLGWGEMGGYHDDDISTSADELQEVQLFTISNQDCALSRGKIDGSRDDYHGQITSSMICATHPKRKDSCSGDSGGPLVKQIGSGDDEEFELAGVVSWGHECAHDDFPGVYARVSAEYNWIQQEVCKRSSCPPSNFECGANPSPKTPPTPSSSSQKMCERKDAKFECKNAGCCWSKKMKACNHCAYHGHNHTPCYSYDGMKKKCKEEGCKWTNRSGTCTAKFDVDGGELASNIF